MAAQPAGETPDQAPVTVFTSRLLLFLAGVALFLALLFREHALSVLSALLLASVGGAKVWSLASHRKLRCTCSLDRLRVFPGETVRLETIVENAKLLPVGIRVDWSVADALQPADEVPEHLPRQAALLWHQRLRWGAALLALRRGLHAAGPSSIRSGDLFGMFARETGRGQGVSVLVYPRLVPVRLTGLPRRELFGSPGVKSLVEDPAYVLGTRDYQGSRPARHIHWKASARLACLQEKLFEPTAKGRVLLALDIAGFQRRGAAAAFEDTLEVVASVAVQLGERGFAVGFLCDAVEGPGRRLVVPGRGPGQLPAILEALALLPLRAGGSLAERMRGSPRLGQDLACLLFCHEPDEDSAAVMRLCRRRGVPSACYLWQSPPETGPSRGPDPVPWRRIDELRVRPREAVS